MTFVRLNQIATQETEPRITHVRLKKKAISNTFRN